MRFPAPICIVKRTAIHTAFAAAIVPRHPDTQPNQGFSGPVRVHLHPYSSATLPPMAIVSYLVASLCVPNLSICKLVKAETRHYPPPMSHISHAVRHAKKCPVENLEALSAS